MKCCLCKEKEANIDFEGVHICKDCIIEMSMQLEWMIRSRDLSYFNETLAMDLPSILVENDIKYLQDYYYRLNDHKIEMNNKFKVFIKNPAKYPETFSRMGKKLISNTEERMEAVRDRIQQLQAEKI